MLVLRRVLVVLALLLPEKAFGQWAQVTLSSVTNGQHFSNPNISIQYYMCSTVAPTETGVWVNGVFRTGSAVVGGCQDWTFRRLYTVPVTLSAGPNSISAEACESQQSPSCYATNTITAYYGTTYGMALNRIAATATPIKEGSSGSYTFKLDNTGYYAGTAILSLSCTGGLVSCSIPSSSVPLPLDGSTTITVSYTGSTPGTGTVWLNAYYAEDVNVGSGSNIDVTVTPKVYAMIVGQTTNPAASIKDGTSGSYNFTIQNTGDLAGTVIFSHQCTGGVLSPCSSSPSSVALAPGQTTTIASSYTGSGAGTGTLWLNAYYAENVNVGSGSNVNVTVTPKVPSMGITPTSATGPTITEGGSGSYVFTFQNNGDLPGTAIITGSCSGTGLIGCSPSPTSVYLVPGASANVTMSYSGYAAGSGSAIANAYYAEYVNTGAGGLVTVTVNPHPVFTVATAGLNPRTTIDRGDCLTSAAGQNAAYECGDLRVVHALPTTITMNKARTPTLLYNSRHARPIAWLAANVRYAGDQPAQLQATVVIAGQTIPKTFTWNTACNNVDCRIVVPIDIPTLSTGLYPATLQVKAVNGSVTYGTSDVLTDTVVIVNRAASPYGAGWWVDGLETVVDINAQKKLWIGGDGSTRLYTQSGGDASVFTVTPTYDRPDTLKQVGSVWQRRLGDGAYVEFDNAGHHLRTVNALGWQTRFVYKTTISGWPLDSIVLPVPSGSSAVRAYTFAYALNANNAPALTSVTAPAASFTRTVSTSRVNHFQITGLTDPDGYSTTFAYDGSSRMTWRRNKLTDTTYFAYDDAGALKQTKLSTARTDGAGTAITTNFQSAETRGAASSSDLPTPLTSVYTLMDGPRVDLNDTQAFFVNRWGAPDTVQNALGQRTRMRRENGGFPALVTTSTAPNGFETRASYNGRGLVESTTAVDPLGQNCGNDSCDAVTRYHWHPTWNHVDTLTGPTGEKTITQYDASLPIPTWIQTGTNTARRTTFSYNSSSLVSSVTPPGIPPTVFEYNTLGNDSVVTSSKGYKSFRYQDAIGQVTLDASPFRDTTAANAFTVDAYTRVSHWYTTMGQDSITTTSGPAAPTYGGTVPADSLRVESSYNAEGNRTRVRRVFTSSGSPWALDNTWTYAAAARVKYETTPSGATTFAYDAAGNVTSRQTNRGLTVTMTYDALNRPTKRVVPQVTYGSQACSSFLTYTYGCSWIFPTIGGSTLCINPDTATFAYNSTGSVIQADNRRARVRRGYYRNGALAQDTIRIRSVKEPVDTPCGSADPDALSGGSEWSAHVYTMVHGYDLSGRRIRTDGPYTISGCSLTPCRTAWAYSGDTGELASVTDGLGRTTNFAYDNASRLDYITFANGIVDDLTYDAESRVVARTVSSHISDAIARDASGRILRASQSGQSTGVGQVDSWYGPLGAVVAVMGGTQSATGSPVLEKFSVDAIGNRRWTQQQNIKPLTHPDQNGERTYTIGSSGALTSVTAPSAPGWSYLKNVAYDPSGNVSTTALQQADYASSGTLWDVSINYYDAADQLRVFNRAVGPYANDENHPGERNVFEEYVYDALGRRVLVRSRRTSTCNTSITECNSYVERTVWDGDQVVYEIRVPGATSASTAVMETDNGIFNFYEANAFGQTAYVHAGGIDQPIVVMRTGFGSASPISVHPHQNWRGLFELGTKSDGTLLSSASGSPQIAWPGAKATTDGEIGNPGDGPVWFGNLIPDKSDGSGMRYMRNRYYDPGTGRFTQEDPIGLAGGMNLYGFASGDPLNFSDPIGLCPICVGVAVWFLENGPTIARIGAALTGLYVGQSGAGNARAAATIGRLTATLEGNLDKLDDLHLEAAGREIGGEVVARNAAGRAFDHVTEVRNAMNGMRRVARDATRLLENGRPTDAQRGEAEALRTRALDLLKKAQEALNTEKKP